tara:strand:- start:1102 stop:1740 length:639 start_codon:yes stop_codon:yes gene_type:complete
MSFIFNIEGLEGASKSTSIETISETLEENGIQCLHYQEPGSTPLALELRRLLKSDHKEIIDGYTELLMMFAARNQLYINEIIPALKAGKVVCLDRSWWSSYAYQVHKRTEDQSAYNLLVDAVKKQAPFDATLFLDVTPEIGLKRAKSRGELDRFEKNALPFFNRAQEGYRHLVATESNAFRIDADNDFNTVQTDVRNWALSLVPRIKNKTES